MEKKIYKIVVFDRWSDRWKTMYKTQSYERAIEYKKELLEQGYTHKQIMITGAY